MSNSVWQIEYILTGIFLNLDILILFLILNILFFTYLLRISVGLKHNFLFQAEVNITLTLFAVLIVLLEDMFHLVVT